MKAGNLTRALRLVAFSLAPTVIVLVVVELGLAAFGLGDREQNVWRGFDPSAQYIVPTPGSPGAFQTQIFEGRRPEVEIPPKSESTRVLLFGGSNVLAFRGDVLGKRLNDERPPGTRPYEVINLGRSGYGSGRVFLLLKQAMALDPDIVVIYSGHNEFVEAGFKADVEAEWQGWEGKAAATASRLRVYNALVDGFGGEAQGLATRAAKPEEIVRDFERLSDQTYDQTLEHVASYKRNLADMCRLALGRDVKVVLCTVVGNDLSAPFSSALPVGFDAGAAEEIQRLTASALEKMPAYLQRVSIARHTDRLRGTIWWIKRKSPRALPPGFTVPPLRSYDGRIGEQTWWPDPKEWGPGVEEFVAALSELHHREIDGEERARLVSAKSDLEAILALAPDHASSLFRLGLIELQLGSEGQGAAELLHRAGRFDRVPRSTNDLNNDLVREVAAELPGVSLFDLARIYRERSPDGIIGFEIMRDECHFYRAYYPVLMEDLAEFLLAHLSR